MPTLCLAVVNGCLCRFHLSETKLRNRAPAIVARGDEGGSAYAKASAGRSILYLLAMLVDKIGGVRTFLSLFSEENKE